MEPIQETGGVYGVFFHSREVQDSFLQSLHGNTKAIQINHVESGYFRGEIIAP